MISIANVEVFGFEAAIRGMRNPMNSWNNSDSGVKEIYGIGYEFVIGENDMKLMKSLSKAGNDHAKFLRMINVTVDITAPLYWWKEFDTYKVGTIANSCSTMHKIHAKEFTIDDFSCEHIGEGMATNVFNDCMENIIDCLNEARHCYLDTKDKKYWWQMIQLLPSSYNQKRTVQLNYQVLKNMYFSRRIHKLDEWRDFCDWMSIELPYFRAICIQE